MHMVIGYGSVALLLIATIVFVELRSEKDESFSKYATAGRDFGPLYATMAYLNSWMPGTIFISFIGLSASMGVVGYAQFFYSALAALLMYPLAERVHRWGSHFDVRTQPELLGIRYNSKAVGVVASIIGLIATLPWIVLGMQSLTVVFYYLSFGAVSRDAAVFVSVAIIALRQVWTVRYGMRGVVLSDMIQGIFAYVLGPVVAICLIVHLIRHGHGFSAVPSQYRQFPGWHSAVGPFYPLSIIIAGLVGGWCWPDVFVRLLSADSPRTLKKVAVRATPMLFVLGGLIATVGLLAVSFPGVAEAPDDVWFIVSRSAGLLILVLASLAVVSASLGNVSANLQALGSQAANDIVGPIQGRRIEKPHIGRVAVTLITLVSLLGALATANSTGGLVKLALVSYFGIVQLAPTIFFGLFTRFGTARAAVTSMIVGFSVAAILQMRYPNGVPHLYGISSGVLALAVNAVVYLAVAKLWPNSENEVRRLDALWAAKDETTELSPTSDHLPA